MPYLEYNLEDSTPLRLSLNRKLTTIGRSADNHLVLEHPSIGETHATILYDRGSYRIKTSSRGHVMRVSGKKTRDKELSHGDLIVLGDLQLSFSTLSPPVSPETTKSNTLHQALDTQNRLITLSHLLLEQENETKLLTALIDEVIALCQADKGFLVLCQDKGYNLCVSRKAGAQPLAKAPELLSDKIVRLVLETQRPQFIANASLDPRFCNSQSVIDLRLSSVMCVPLVAKAKFLGLIYVGSDRPTHQFLPDQLEVLQIFAAQAALLVQTANRLTDLRQARADLQEKLQNMRFGALVGACPQMLENFRRIDKAAPSEIPIWLHGEPGTGKELLAREIHQRSPRNAGPLIVVNCAVLPAPALKEQLFGRITPHGIESGAIAQAAGGTLYLSEIDHLPAALQLDLLSAMQDGHQIQTPHGNVRIIASSNLSPTELLSTKTLREELFFRLRVVDLQLPALRERGGDLPLIARFILQRELERASSAGGEAQSIKFSDASLRAISRFDWPGNIRQLENHIKKAVVLAEGPELSPRDLGLSLGLPSQLDQQARSETTILPLAEAKEQWQKDYINRALALNDGNRAKTARDLGVDPRTIFRHLERIERQKRDQPS